MHYLSTIRFLIKPQLQSEALYLKTMSFNLKRLVLEFYQHKNVPLHFMNQNLVHIKNQVELHHISLIGNTQVHVVA